MELQRLGRALLCSFHESIRLNGSVRCASPQIVSRHSRAPVRRRAAYAMVSAAARLLPVALVSRPPLPPGATGCWLPAGGRAAGPGPCRWRWVDEPGAQMRSESSPVRYVGVAPRTGHPGLCTATRAAAPARVPAPATWGAIRTAAAQAPASSPACRGCAPSALGNVRALTVPPATAGAAVAWTHRAGAGPGPLGLVATWGQRLMRCPCLRCRRCPLSLDTLRIIPWWCAGDWLGGPAESVLTAAVVDELTDTPATKPRMPGLGWPTSRPARLAALQAAE